MNKQRLSITVILCAILLAAPARADIQFSTVGILAAESVNHVSGMHQYGVVLKYRVDSQSTSFWVPSTLDVTAGLLEGGSDSASLVSFGPSYRFDMRKSEAGRWFVDFGVHPTLLSKSTFDGRHLGGSFHFTSHVGLGAYLGRQKKTSLSLRLQHTSNAGLNRSNPGLDMLGLRFSYHFGSGQQLLSATETTQK